MFIDKQFEISQSYIRLLITIFVFAVLAKGSVIFRGFSIDDYLTISGTSNTDQFISQGRYVMAATVWAIDSLGANIKDMYFSLGIVLLFFYSAFIVSILRFVGMSNSPTAALVGAIMVAHPYSTEIFTFRLGLPGYCIALIFSIVALEMVTISPATWGTRAVSLLATFAMLLTYQVFLNYFAVAIIFSFICSLVLQNLNTQPLAINNVYRERATTFTSIIAIAVTAFVSIIWLSKAFGLTNLTERANFITLDMMPERLEQILSSLVSIYWSAEPVVLGGLKTLVALMLVVSVIIVFSYLLKMKGKENYISNILFTFFAFLLLAPVSLGVIIAFKDWWPVPRVISHVAIVIGLIFLLADSFIHDSGNRFLKSTIFVSRLVVLIGFVLLSNQILADQQRVNQWDKMMANRIISRLEIHPNFRDVQFVYINQGSWGFPANLRTVQGDMNISAFSPDWSRVALLSEVSGYRFEKASGTEAAIGENYCKLNQPWPHADSVTVANNVAIICLRK